MYQRDNIRQPVVFRAVLSRFLFWSAPSPYPWALSRSGTMEKETETWMKEECNDKLAEEKFETLEKVVIDSNINSRGNIFNKSIQLLVFADDIDIIARTPTAVKQAFLSFEKEVLWTGLKINENKTKYMPCTKSCFNNSHFYNRRV
ncbi:putative endonuclease-reverse transcriptase [Trichonephila clavipes]|nr:putative endonuclease-reverse transcriptase [Trichonephila clavipes]